MRCDILLALTLKNPGNPDKADGLCVQKRTLCEFAILYRHPLVRKMLQKIRKPATCLLVLALFSYGFLPTTAMAGTFKKTKVMDLKYAWGTTSMAEFDFYDQLYPGYFPIAEVTFQPDGTFTAYDTASGSSGSGVYVKQGGYLLITIVNPQFNGIVQYEGQKVAPKTFEGEILVNGTPCGNWRGKF